MTRKSRDPESEDLSEESDKTYDSDLYDLPTPKAAGTGRKKKKKQKVEDTQTQRDDCKKLFPSDQLATQNGSQQLADSKPKDRKTYTPILTEVLPNDKQKCIPREKQPSDITYDYYGTEFIRYSGRCSGGQQELQHNCSQLILDSDGGKVSFEIINNTLKGMAQVDRLQVISDLKTGVWYVHDNASDVRVGKFEDGMCLDVIITKDNAGDQRNKKDVIEFCTGRSEFFTETLSFSTLYNNTCIEGKNYRVPVGEKSGDGLAEFIVGKVCEALCQPDTNTGKSDKTSSSELAACLKGAKLKSLEMRIAQLRLQPHKHELKTGKSTTPTLHCGTVCLPNGEQYGQIKCPLDRMRSSSLQVEFVREGESTSEQLTLNWPAGKSMTWTLEQEGKHRDTAEMRMQSASIVFSPSTWLYDEVLKARREHGVGEYAEIDPMDIARLTCVSRGNAASWADLILIESQGRFKSIPLSKKNGDTGFQMWYCDVNTNIWQVDDGEAAFYELIARIRVNICSMPSDSEYFEKLVACAGELNRLSIPSDSILSESVDAISRKCKGYSNWLGNSNVLDQKNGKKGIDSFKRMVMDRSSATDFEVNLQVNFNNSVCYDISTREIRLIAPEDNATLSTCYPYEDWDEEKQKSLSEMFSEIHPDHETWKYRLSRKARCLTASQANPNVMFSFGQGGAGKGTEVNLTLKAFGQYGLIIDEQLLRTKPSTAEGPTSAKTGVNSTSNERNQV